MYSNEGEGAERAKLLVFIYGYDQNLSLYCDLSTDEKGVVVCVMDSVTDSLMSTCTHICRHICTKPHTRTHMQTCTHAHMLAHTHTHTCIRTYKHTCDMLVERRRHVAAVYVMIVNCWTSHGRRTFMTTFRSVCADLPQVNLRKISTA